MPLRGWYPDPDATPGRFRFWDGSAWTGDTTFQPEVAPGNPDQRRRRVVARGRLLTTAILVVLLLITLVGAVAVIQSRDRTPVAAPGPARPSTSAWDDSSPYPSTTVTPLASPSATPSPRAAGCDAATSDELATPASDGRVHGGPLSFRQLATPWSRPSPTGRFPFSRDSQVQTLRLEEKLPWQASAQVGVVAFDAYPGGHVAAESMLNCLLTSDFYTSIDVTVGKSTGSDITIGDHRASRLDALLTFTHPDLKTTGSQVRIIVVDTSPATYYFHAVPQERSDLITVLDRATDTLTAT